MRHVVRVLALATVAALAAACGGTATSPTPPPSPTYLPQIVSSEVAVGPNRILLSILDTRNRPVASPELALDVAFSGPAGEQVQASDPQFVWAIEDEVGVYVSAADFPAPGDWTATFTTTPAAGAAEQAQFRFTVREDPAALRPGEAAPAVDTPTADDVGGDLALLSTDEDPLPRFYEASVADALDAGEPFVLAFATPKFCASAQCGPTLDRLKAIAAGHPDLTFINVEPYALEPDANGQLQPVLAGDPPTLQAVEAVRAFGLLSEPYVFVVDGDGKISAGFELIFGDEEIEAAIAELG